MQSSVSRPGCKSQNRTFAQLKPVESSKVIPNFTEFNSSSTTGLPGVSLASNGRPPIIKPEPERETILPVITELMQPKIDSDYHNTEFVPLCDNNFENGPQSHHQYQHHHNLHNHQKQQTPQQQQKQQQQTQQQTIHNNQQPIQQQQNNPNSISHHYHLQGQTSNHYQDIGNNLQEPRSVEPMPVTTSSNLTTYAMLQTQPIPVQVQATSSATEQGDPSKKGIEVHDQSTILKYQSLDRIETSINLVLNNNNNNMKRLTQNKQHLPLSKPERKKRF